jgi:hypothetical protein
MKHLFSIILLVLTFLCVLGLVGTIDKQSEELIMVKQLHNVQQQILEDNFSENELDSLYLEYNYYYLNSYYKNNY